MLYVDETENQEYFIVAGLLVRSKLDIDNAFKRFKKYVKSIPINNRDKAILFTEFKSTLIDRRYSRIKFRMIDELCQLEHTTLYSCYVKKGSVFSQNEKEIVYIKLLSKIIDAVDNQIDVIFDTFNKPDFETKIIEEISKKENVLSILSADSQEEYGLQFVDNMCSIARLHKSNNDKYGFYDKIVTFIKEV